MKRKIMTNKMLVLTTIFIAALFIGTSISPVLAEDLDDAKLARKNELREEEEASSDVVTPDSGSDSMVVVLDLPAILADTRLIIYEEVL